MVLMAMMRTWRTTTADAGATERLGEVVGAALRGGEVIELVSDLGGGKTTFVRGVARGLGSTDKVASPTFTISRQYQAGSLTLHHFDFYRLAEPGLMADELAEVLADPQAIIVVEWGALVGHVLPAERLSIDLKATGETGRALTFTYPAALARLIPEDTQA